MAGAVLSIGVCVFITWFSRDVDRTTIFFNLGFLALMLCMILAASLTGIAPPDADHPLLKAGDRSDP